MNDYDDVFSRKIRMRALAESARATEICAVFIKCVVGYFNQQVVLATCFAVGEALTLCLLTQLSAPHCSQLQTAGEVIILYKQKSMVTLLVANGVVMGVIENERRRIERTVIYASG